MTGSARRSWRAELDEARLTGLAEALADVAPERYVVFLRGELGAGKTTFARAFVRRLLPGARVKSPTFALVEPYALPKGSLYHVDLYRVSDPSELDALALRESMAPGNGLLIEWPERAAGSLPDADLEVSLAHAAHRRNVALSAASPAGEEWLERLLR